MSPKKTVITHVEKGVDFLEQNLRRYPNGKLLIKLSPARKVPKLVLFRCFGETCDDEGQPSKVWLHCAVNKIIVRDTV